MTAAFITVSVLTVVISFALLSRVLRDVRLRTSAPGMTGLAGKTIVAAILISHMGLLLWPEMNTFFWFVFDAGVAFGLYLLYISFYAYHRRVALRSGRELQIAEAHYTEVDEGIRARAYKLGDPPLFSFELRLVEWLKTKEIPEGSTILFHQSRRGSRFDRADKDTDEWLFILLGRARLSERVTIEAGQERLIPAQWEHYYLAEDDTVGCSVIWPE